MAGEMVFRIDGLEEAQRQLRELAKRYGRAAGRALLAEAEVEMTEAKRRCPVLTGALRASGHVSGKAEALPAEVTLSFGGPAAPYAVFVHENEDALHENGESKFLERPLLEAAPHLAERIARRIASEAA